LKTTRQNKKKMHRNGFGEDFIAKNIMMKCKYRVWRGEFLDDVLLTN
jgi:hypothetical protein